MAIVTLNIPSKLNAMNGDNYYRLSCLMFDIAKYVLLPYPHPFPHFTNISQDG
jgi:hypothetical protein